MKCASFLSNNSSLNKGSYQKIFWDTISKKTSGAIYQFQVKKIGAIIKDEEETDFENFNPMFNDVFALGNTLKFTKYFILFPIFKQKDKSVSSFKIVQFIKSSPCAPSVINLCHFIIQLETKYI